MEHLNKFGSRDLTRAQSLLGRLYVTKSGIDLVQGLPDPELLVQWINKCVVTPTIESAPAASLIGFRNTEIFRVTRSGLASRASALQRFRASTAHHRRSKNRSANPDLDALSTRVELLYSLLIQPQSLEQTPFYLEEEARIAFESSIRQLAAERVITPEVHWLSRLITWIAGQPAANRFLATVRDGLDDPLTYQSRVILDRVLAMSNRLKKSRKDLEQLRQEIIFWPVYAREAKPQIQSIRAELNQLTDDRVIDLVRLPSRDRDIDLDRLISQCHQAISQFNTPLKRPVLADLATLYVCDGSNVSLPISICDACFGKSDSGNSKNGLKYLLRESVQRGYEDLLNTLASVELIVDPDDFGTIRELLLRGVSSQVIHWASTTIFNGYTTIFNCYTRWKNDANRLQSLHAFTIWLESNGSPISLITLREIWNESGGLADQLGFECLQQFLSWLPSKRADPAIVNAVRGVLGLLTLSGDLRGPFRDRFHRWADPSRRGPLPEGCPSDLSNDVIKLLRRLSFHQQLVGEPIRLPKSLRKLLDQDLKFMNERKHLLELERLNQLDEGAKARLRYLSRRESIKPTSTTPNKLIRQAREVCAVAAINSLNYLFQQQAEQWWKLTFPQLPKLDGLRFEDSWELMAWIEKLDSNQKTRVNAILSSFCQQGTNYRYHLSDNARWISEFQQLGGNLAAWFQPAPLQVTLSDRCCVNIRTASDPREVFLMGTWSNTCLNLRHGVNRTSVISNAADANKAIVVAYRDDDSPIPIARKLVAVTPDYRLVGYQEYSSYQNETAELRQALEVFCATWAARSGLMLSDKGVPESLSRSFWYDDGTIPWSQEARACWFQHVDQHSIVQVSALKTDNEDESTWCDVLRKNDPTVYEQFISSIRQPEWRVSAAIHYVTQYPTRAMRWPDWSEAVSNSHDWWRYGWNRVACRFAQLGKPEAALLATRRIDSHDDDGSDEVVFIRNQLLQNTTSTKDRVVLAIRTILSTDTSLAIRESDFCFCCLLPPPHTALAPLNLLIDLFLKFSRLFLYVNEMVRCGGVD